MLMQIRNDTGVEVKTSAKSVRLSAVTHFGLKNLRFLGNGKAVAFHN